MVDGADVGSRLARALRCGELGLLILPATFGAGLQMASLIGAADNAGWQRNTSYNLTTAAKSAAPFTLGTKIPSTDPWLAKARASSCPQAVSNPLIRTNRNLRP